ncbi:glycine/D-amino acid oxidase, deaminating [Herbaspirillum sp. CF444]|uniref:NAD(P)/FAD-dependent oxidoreductase n=1 Tax=Herbaspirillum sp. CF444 TaxID=1144319 RepID=UPI00027283C7|nr:FAD-binding oxidoreductase [Herbaspirillum sp. CF444]EJL90891.1 glycine/D-amino acid oxidase, deaminating [Herbaspirillum sp. CF444]
MQDHPSSSSGAAAQADFLIIGAGIAGASIAYWLAPHASVIVLERETQPGYHSTGRSAALYMESYGPPQVRALTCASRAFFDHPPPGFTEHPLLTPRGALFIARPDQLDQLDAHEAIVRSVSDKVQRLNADQACARVPVLRREDIGGAIYEEDAADIDVNGLHQGFLRGARAAGARVVCDAGVLALAYADDQWQVSTSQGTFRAPVVINAAGAWADVVGKMAGAKPIGLVPKRRSAFTFAVDVAHDSAAWPMFMNVDESFYVKPDAGLLLGSPANADPVEPHDVQAEELDIAIAIDQIQNATTLAIRRPSHVWAGLRSFVDDGSFVGGFDDALKGFFWAAGQGGYGIQTAPAAGETYAALARGLPVPAPIASFGVKAEALSRDRIR